MEVTIKSIPAEVLLQIFGYLPSKWDVYSARLVCRVLAEVGRSALGTKVTFALVPESIARLNEISLHPFFSQHITAITCVANVFRPFGNIDDFKGAMGLTIIYQTNGNDRIWASEEEWKQSWGHYNALLAAQGAAFKSLEPSQGMEIVCSRFAKLQNLRICHYPRGTPPPYHLHSNRSYEFLSKTHGDLRDYFTLPAYEVGIFPPNIAVPGVHILGPILSNTNADQLRSLRVDALGIEAFDEEREVWFEDNVYPEMLKVGPNLSVLDLCIYVKYDREGWQGFRAANRIMANNRAKSFLSAASQLEDVKLKFFSVSHDREYPFYAEIKDFWPTGHTWPRLRKLRLTNVEMVTYVFMDFLGAHIETLKDLGLKNCLMLDSPQFRQKGRRCIWSDFFIPMVTTFPLTNLSLRGRFKLIKPPGRGLDEDPRLFSNPPTIYAHDVVEGVKIQDRGLTVGKTIEMMACSGEFDSFLEHEVAGDRELVVNIKEEIIRDLMDYYVVDREGQLSVTIATRHAEYLKSFASGGS
ncbi:unnamed protein product [Clonostachys byssicola]|uniref:F-box domain-containing protein n=1 Tax=Clonostachys byssicola TaxID=160290 RepID=A0A9N9UNM4_9HYPO|nr:unnamed protein product [Clonostachys byssicola]